MLVPVHFDDGIETFFQNLAICSKADDREDDSCVGSIAVVTTDLEDFRGVTGIDTVARCTASVSSEDCEVFACNSKRRTPIVLVTAVESRVSTPYGEALD
jgi:hypothetical protein